jgi:tRNA-Thr(GGU) m(6)t(6)A37 methyltransferase TsaA
MEKTMETLNGDTVAHGFTMKPIATFICEKKNPYEASRQGASSANENEIAEIRFNKGSQFEQALDGIEGCTHLWLIYQFHKNSHWNPKVQPPRGASQKMGVFATRSPYRPNHIGMSCVELVERKGLSLFVKKFDLLDGTPIWDVKPYLAYSDSFPEAKVAWLDGIESQKFDVQFSNRAHEQLLWLESRGLDQFRNFIVQQLEFDPLNAKKKRLVNKTEHRATLCYRTWRADFSAEQNLVIIEKIFSGYSQDDLQISLDPYQDKDLHRVYIEHRLQPVIAAPAT